MDLFVFQKPNRKFKSINLIHSLKAKKAQQNQPAKQAAMLQVKTTCITLIITGMLGKRRMCFSRRVCFSEGFVKSQLILVSSIATVIPSFQCFLETFQLYNLSFFLLFTEYFCSPVFRKIKPLNLAFLTVQTLLKELPGLLQEKTV